MNFLNPNTIHKNPEAKIIESEITSTRANMDVLRRRLCETQKKEIKCMLYHFNLI